MLGALTIVGAQEPPRTWRLDFYQTGGPGIEAYSFDRLVVEPLAWPDSPAANVEPTPTGNYRFEVVDAARTRDVLARLRPGVCRVGDDGRSEAVRRTLPRLAALSGADRQGRHRRLRKRNGERRLRRSVAPRRSILPIRSSIDRAPARQQAIEVERHGEPQAKVDVLLLGDGYTAAECSRKFRADARRMADALFALEPFTSRRNDFNVWGICPPAAESGISRPSTGIYRARRSAPAYDAFGSERYILTFENRAWRDIAAWAPYEFVTILTNSDTYGGGGLYNVYLDGRGRQRLRRLPLRPRVRASLRRPRRRVLTRRRSRTSRRRRWSSRGRRTSPRTRTPRA